MFVFLIWNTECGSRIHANGGTESFATYANPSHVSTIEENRATPATASLVLIVLMNENAVTATDEIILAKLNRVATPIVGYQRSPCASKTRIYFRFVVCFCRCVIPRAENSVLFYCR